MCGPHTEAIDGTGRLVLPGIVDVHVHPPMAGIEMLRCDLTSVSTRAEYAAAVAAYANAHPGTEWIRGGGWSMAAFPNGLPVADDLDTAVGRRPVYLPNRDHHSAWVAPGRSSWPASRRRLPTHPMDVSSETGTAGRPGPSTKAP